MLYLNLPAVMANKGIKDPSRLLVKAGMSYPAAYRLLYVEIKTMNLHRLEQLCMILNCTPNDLLIWVPDNDVSNARAHPLHALKKNSNKTVVDHLRNLPMNKIEAVRVFIEGMIELEEEGS
jgi:DNA-binding Xre family transcriptional regulator